jgi:methanogenic corrinoid protein MtbC1
MNACTKISEGTFGKFFDALRDGDRDSAIDAALAEIDRGISAEEVLLQLLIPAQAEVGSKWQEGGWSVAQEHLATACTDAVLTAVTTHARTPRPTHGTVVVACVEEEWHALPARMFAELLLLRGWKQSFLGVAIPPHSLKSFLANAEPVALALSCSVAMNLSGAAGCIDAAHSLGIPVVVGGRGFGNNDHRARKVFADAWGQTVEDACKTLTQWSVNKPRVVRPVRRTDGEDFKVMAERHAIAECAFESLREKFKSVAELDPERTRLLKKDLSIHLRFVESALLTEDPTVYLDFLVWNTWSAPGVAPVDGFTSEIVEALSAEVPSNLVATARLFASAKQHLEAKLVTQ